MNANNSQTLGSPRFIRGAILAVLLVAAAFAIGNAMPRATQSKPVAQTNSASQITVLPPLLKSAGWLYYQEPRTAKWFAVYYSRTAARLIDDPIELGAIPEMAGSRQEPCELAGSMHYPIDC